MNRTLLTRFGLVIPGLAVAGILAYGAGSEPAVQGTTPEVRNPGGNDPIVVTAEQRIAVEKGLAWLASQQAPNGSWKQRLGYKQHEDYA